MKAERELRKWEQKGAGHNRVRHLIISSGRGSKHASRTVVEETRQDILERTRDYSNGMGKDTTEGDASAPAKAGCIWDEANRREVSAK